jgi:hypothetical protein
MADAPDVPCVPSSFLRLGCGPRVRFFVCLQLVFFSLLPYVHDLIIMFFGDFFPYSGRPRSHACTRQRFRTTHQHIFLRLPLGLCTHGAYLESSGCSGAQLARCSVRIRSSHPPCFHVFSSSLRFPRLLLWPSTNGKSRLVQVYVVFIPLVHDWLIPHGLFAMCTHARTQYNHPPRFLLDPF